MAELPKTRKTYHHGDLRNALIAAALELVALKGVEGFSLREAARLVGVSASAAYRHFGDKADLLAAVASEGFARLAREMEEALEQAQKEKNGVRDTAAAFKAIGLAYVQFAVRHPAQFRVMFGPYGAGSDRDVRGVGQRGRAPYELLGDVLDDMVSAGVLRSERRLHAEVLAWVAVHGLATLLVDRALQVRDESELLRLFELVARHTAMGLGITSVNPTPL